MDDAVRSYVYLGGTRLHIADWLSVDARGTTERNGRTVCGRFVPAGHALCTVNFRGMQACQRCMGVRPDSTSAILAAPADRASIPSIPASPPMKRGAPSLLMRGTDPRGATSRWRGTPSAHAADSSRRRADRWRSRRVLIVDDHAENAESMSLFLGMEGYDVRVATSGTAGIAFAGRWDPDVVVLDLALSDVSGEEVAAAMRGAGSQAYLVAYSGHHQREAAALSAGCDCFVLKPHVDAIRVAIQAAWRKAHA